MNGSADKCPSVPGGVYDSNRNGCPGPFAFINASPPHFQAVFGDRFLKLQELSMTGLAPRTMVSFSAALTRETVTVGSSGVARSRTLPGRLGYGTPLEIAATRRAFVGSYFKLVADKRVGLKLVGTPAGLRARGRPRAGDTATCAGAGVSAEPLRRSRCANVSATASSVCRQPLVQMYSMSPSSNSDGPVAGCVASGVPSSCGRRAPGGARRGRRSG